MFFPWENFYSFEMRFLKNANTGLFILRGNALSAFYKDAMWIFQLYLKNSKYQSRTPTYAEWIGCWSCAHTQNTTQNCSPKSLETGKMIKGRRETESFVLEKLLQFQVRKMGVFSLLTCCSIPYLLPLLVGENC